MGATVLKAISVIEEVTWSTAPASGYTRIPAEEITCTPDTEYLDRAIQTTTLATRQTGIKGAQGATLTFSVGLHGLAAAATGAASEHAWIGPIMKACGFALVGAAVGTGTTISGTASTTTSVNVVSAAGFDVGSIVVIAGEARLVTAVDTASTPDAITVTPALSAAPTTEGVVVYASATYQPITDSTPDSTLSFVYKGDGYDYVLSGCNGTFELPSVSANGRPMLNFSFSANKLDRDASGTGTFPSLGTLPTPIVAKSSPLWWGASKRGVREMSFSPGLTLAPQLTTEDANGRAAWAYSDGEPVASLVAYRSTDANDALQTDYETPTTRTVLAQLGSAAGAMFVIAAEVAQIVAYPAEGDADGLVTLPISLGIKAPTTTSMPVAVVAFC